MSSSIAARLGRLRVRRSKAATNRRPDRPISATSGTLAAASADRPAEAIGEASRPNAIDPDEALARLIAGNARYVDDAPISKDFSVGRAARAAARHPIACIVGRADARVAPDFVFDQGPATCSSSAWPLTS